MTLGDKIADSIPESALEFVHEHPRVLYAVTLPCVAFAAYNLVKALRLHMTAESFVLARASDAARAASEALGG